MPRRRPEVVGLEKLEVRSLLSAAVSGVGSAGLASTELVTLQARPAGAAAYKALAALPKLRASAVQNFYATSLSAFTTSVSAMRKALRSAPMQDTPAAADSPLLFYLPKPDGTYDAFDVWEAPIMEGALASKYKTIKTYAGQGVTDPTETVRFDVTPQGLHAQVLGGTGAYYVDPIAKGNAGTYGSYWRTDALLAPGVASYNFDEGDETAGGTLSAQPTLDADTLANLTDDGTGGGGGTATAALTTYPAANLRIFRLAIAANHQYAAAVGGGTVSGTLAAIVTAMNRVDGVYETELAVRMDLVANETSLIYTSAASDPYTSNDGNVINTSTSKFNAALGSANYDVGHIFTTGSGGVAYLGVVGNNSLKAGGTTGLPSPTGDAFYIDYVAHEMGHQFGADHTFNTAGDTGNRNASTAYEIGSGTTIMAYAGIEGADDLAQHSDPYFHAISISEIRNYLATVPSVGTTQASNNTSPTVSATQPGVSYAIPTGTPFALTATGSDPDGNAITYTWEELDKGAATTLASLTTTDNAASPRFRSYLGTTSPTRTVPLLATVLAGSTTTLGYASHVQESLYLAARTSTWRVTARDNVAAAGGVSTDDVKVTVVNTGSAFAVTSWNSAATVPSGSAQTVTWNVAGTTANGINIANVKISLSIDGGNTFPYVLAASATNSGTASVTLPTFTNAYSTARVKVEAVGGIFFDVNNANVTLSAVTLPPVPSAPALDAASDTGASSSDRITRYNNASPASALTFSVGNAAPGNTVSLFANGTLVATVVATGSTATLSTNGASALADGSVTFTASQTSSTGTSAPSSATAVLIDTVAPASASLGTIGTVLNVGPSSDSLTFNEPVVLPVVSSFSLTADGAPVALASAAVAGSGSTFQLLGLARYTSGTARYVLSFSGSVSDLAGNSAALSASPAFFAVNVIALPDNPANTLRLESTGASGINLYVNNASPTPTFAWTFSAGQKLRIETSTGDDTVSFSGTPNAYNADVQLIPSAGSDHLDVLSGNFISNYDLTASTSARVLSGGKITFNTPTSLASLSVSSGGTALANANLAVNAFSSAGVVDLTTHDMLVRNASAAAVAALLQFGNLTSSVAGTGSGRDRYAALAVAQNSDGQGGTLLSAFDALPVTTADVLVKYTYQGDTDLDGVVNAADLSNLLAGLNGGLAGWISGDTNHDGVINAADRDNLLAALQNQGAPFA